MKPVEHIKGERLLTVKEAAEIIGTTRGTLDQARVSGRNFPGWVKIGTSVRYKLSTVLKWIADQEEHKTTSEADAKKEELKQQALNTPEQQSPEKVSI